MNEKKFLSYLNKYHSWLKEHKAKAEEELAEREVHAKDMKKWTKDKLLNMSEEDFFNLLSPLWAMGMWGNKHYVTPCLALCDMALCDNKLGLVPVSL